MNGPERQPVPVEYIPFENWIALSPVSIAAVHTVGFEPPNLFIAETVPEIVIVTIGVGEYIDHNWALQSFSSSACDPQQA